MVLAWAPLSVPSGPVVTVELEGLMHEGLWNFEVTDSPLELDKTVTPFGTFFLSGSV